MAQSNSVFFCSRKPRSVDLSLTPVDIRQNCTQALTLEVRNFSSQSYSMGVSCLSKTFTRGRLSSTQASLYHSMKAKWHVLIYKINVGLSLFPGRVFSVRSHLGFLLFSGYTPSQVCVLQEQRAKRCAL